MKVLLIVFAFVMNPQGSFEWSEVYAEQFDTLEECNFAGQNLREIYLDDLSPEVKTLSVCVTPEHLLG